MTDQPRTPLLPLCSIPQLVSRDGNAGPYAHVLLPNYPAGQGVYFFSGLEGTFPGASIPQFTGNRIGGLNMPDTFCKDALDCLNKSVV